MGLSAVREKPAFSSFESIPPWLFVFFSESNSSSSLAAAHSTGTMAEKKLIRITPRFDVGHHEMNRRSLDAKLKWWRGEIARGFRCSICWLRHYECYCPQFEVRKQYYAATECLQHVSVVMYYHYQELGRSANTAHVMQAVCPSSHFQVVIYGDTTAEQQLVQVITP